MNNLKRILVITLMLGCVTGCGKVPTLKNGEDAIVSFDKGAVSVNTLYDNLKDKYGVQEIINLADTEIFNSMFEETKEEKEYIKKQIDDTKKYAKEQNVSFSSLLEMNGLKSEKEYKNMLKLDYRRNLAINNKIEKDIKDDEIKAYYEDEIYGDIKAQHILISPDTNDEMTEEQKKESDKKAKDKALDIIKKLDKKEDFSKLAKKYSDDSSNASKGGDLGWIARGDMVPEFDDAAFKLEKGKYTKKPIKTTYGYHIILKNDEKDKPKLKDAKKKIIDALVKEKLTNDPLLYHETLEKIRKDAGFKIEDKDLQNAYSIYMKNLKTNIKNQAKKVE